MALLKISLLTFTSAGPYTPARTDVSPGETAGEASRTSCFWGGAVQRPEECGNRAGGQASPRHPRSSAPICWRRFSGHLLPSRLSMLPHL